VNESGRKEGEKKETQSGRRMAEKVGAGGYPELQPMYDRRTSTSLIQLWQVATHCQGQMYVHARAKSNVASTEIEGDVGDDVGDELELRNGEGYVEDEIVVVRAGCSEDDVGADAWNPSP
jgi:hypothetical protein